jgi:hypothetical protein
LIWIKARRPLSHQDALVIRGKTSAMSITQPDQSFDSGHDHLRPFLVAVAIIVATVAICLAFSGLPH